MYRCGGYYSVKTEVVLEKILKMMRMWPFSLYIAAQHSPKPFDIEKVMILKSYVTFITVGKPNQRRLKNCIQFERGCNSYYKRKKWHREYKKIEIKRVEFFFYDGIVRRCWNRSLCLPIRKSSEPRSEQLHKTKKEDHKVNGWWIHEKNKWKLFSLQWLSKIFRWSHK